MLGQYCTCHYVLSARGVWYPTLTERNNRKISRFKFWQSIMPQKSLRSEYPTCSFFIGARWRTTSSSFSFERKPFFWKRVNERSWFSSTVSRPCVCLRLDVPLWSQEYHTAVFLTLVNHKAEHGKKFIHFLFEETIGLWCIILHIFRPCLKPLNNQSRRYYCWVY